MQLPHSGLRPGQSLYSFHSPRHPCKKQTHIRPSAVYQQPPAYGNTPPQQQFVTTPSPYPPQQQQPPLQRTIAAPTPAPYVPPAVRADDAVYLGRSQLVNKQVVTRTTGRSLGYISQMYVDTGRLEVVYMDLKPTQLATETRANLLLSSLRQIGDVVLVHDDSVLYDEVYGEQYGYGKLVSAVVETEAGVVLGKIRDYLFSPDTGSIGAIKYDAFGLPLLPASLVKTYSLGVEMIVAANVNKVIVRAGAENVALQETEGTIDSAIMSVMNFFTADPGIEAADDYMDEWVNDYQRWKAMYGEQYKQATGMDPPMPPMAAAAVNAPRAPNQAYQPPSPPTPSNQQWWQQPQQQPQQQQPRTPLQLPQPSQANYQQVLDFQQAGAPAAAQGPLAGRPVQEVLQGGGQYEAVGGYGSGGRMGSSRRSRRLQRMEQQQEGAPSVGGYPQGGQGAAAYPQAAPPSAPQQQQGGQRGAGRAPQQDPRFRGNRASAGAPTAPQPQTRLPPPQQPQQPQQPIMQQQQDTSSTTVSIRAFELPRDTRPAYQRQDADGGFGVPPTTTEGPPAQRPAVLQQQQQQGGASGGGNSTNNGGVPIDQWLQPAPRQQQVSGVWGGQPGGTQGTVDSDWWGR